MNKRLLSLVVLAAFGAGAQAKLPAPDDAAKAKAAETTAKAAWQAKIDAYKLCQTQDRVAAKFKSNGKAPAATPVVAKAAEAPAGGAAPAPAASSGNAAPGAAAPTTTPAAAKPPAPCTDPGPFAFNPPEQKPLETSGAHSPTGTSGSPPSVRPESAQMVPAKPSTAPSGGAATK